MEHPYGYYLDEYGQPVMPNQPRPGYRTRHASDIHRRPLMYHAGSSGYLAPAPAFGEGLHRSVSAAGQRVPVQVTIHNTQADDHLLARPRSAHDSEWGYDDDWDERAHSSPRREHRSRSRARAKTHGSRDLSPYYRELEIEQRLKKLELLEIQELGEHSRSRSRARAKTHGSRDPSPYYRDFETEQRLKKLELLEKKEQEEEARKRLEEELLLKRAKEEAAKAAKEKEEKELRKRAVEEDRIKQKEKEEKEKQEKKAAEEAFREQVKKKFGAAGWSDETIEEILDKGKRGDHAKVKPTCFKVHRDYMLPAVLDMYHLPWEWHEVSGCISLCGNGCGQWLTECDSTIPTTSSSRN